MDPTSTQLNNRTLGASIAGSTSTSGSSSSDGSGTSELSNYLSTNPIDQQNSTIMDNYAKARSLSDTATQNMAGSINKEYDPKIEYQKTQNQNEQTSAMEAQRGFAQNTAALTQLQNTADKRIRDLTTQRDQMLLANNSAGAARLSDLVVKEQDTLTNARQAWVQNLLGLNTAQNTNISTGIAQSEEARAQAGFETPEEKRQRDITAATKQSIISLAQTAPDAGILPTDDYATAVQKYRNSPSFKRNVQQGEANIAQAQAAAEASAAESARTRTLTGLISGSGDEQDVQDLIDHKISPQDLQDKYANATNGGDRIKQILSQAQAKGYDLNTGNLQGKSQRNLNSAVSSGNLLTYPFAKLQSLIQTPAGGKSFFSPAKNANGFTPEAQSILDKYGVK